MIGGAAVSGELGPELPQSRQIAAARHVRDREVLDQIGVMLLDQRRERDEIQRAIGRDDRAAPHLGANPEAAPSAARYSARAAGRTSRSSGFDSAIPKPAHLLIDAGRPLRDRRCPRYRRGATRTPRTAARPNAVSRALRTENGRYEKNSINAAPLGNAS